MAKATKPPATTLISKVRVGYDSISIKIIDLNKCELSLKWGRNGEGASLKGVNREVATKILKTFSDIRTNAKRDLDVEIEDFKKEVESCKSFEELANKR